MAEADGSGIDIDLDLVRELTEACGVPGYEERVRAIVRRELDGSVDRIEGDAMGNVVGTLKGESDFVVAVAAHMDEVGFMVRHVDDDGFVQVDALGGWDARVLRAHRVTIHTADGDLPGIIGSAPPHTTDDEEQTTTYAVEDVNIDVGLPAERAKDRIAPGDLVTMDQDTRLVGEHVTGKALDDRICLYAMLEAARRIEDPAITLQFAATVQEEVGLRGATALGTDLDPDLAIALDVTVANDIPGVEESQRVTALGDGPAIKLKDSSVITNPKVNRRLRQLCTERDIAHQLEVLPRGGTDTGGFQRAAGAIPVGALSVPTRYLHTVTESVHVRDVTATTDLLAAFLETETGEHDYTL